PLKRRRILLRGACCRQLSAVAATGLQSVDGITCGDEPRTQLRVDVAQPIEVYQVLLQPRRQFARSTQLQQLYCASGLAPLGQPIGRVLEDRAGVADLSKPCVARGAQLDRPCGSLGGLLPGASRGGWLAGSLV